MINFLNYLCDNYFANKLGKQIITDLGVFDIDKKYEDKMPLEEAETIINDMYQDRNKILENNNVIDLSRLDDVKFTNLEFASVIVLREIQSLERKLEKSIPVSLVKEKIEELDIQISECEYADDDIEERKQDIEKEKRLLLRDKKTLQELLGEE